MDLNRGDHFSATFFSQCVLILEFRSALASRRVWADYFRKSLDALEAVEKELKKFTVGITKFSNPKIFVNPVSADLIFLNLNHFFFWFTAGLSFSPNIKLKIPMRLVLFIEIYGQRVSSVERKKSGESGGRNWCNRKWSRWTWTCWKSC